MDTGTSAIARTGPLRSLVMLAGVYALVGGIVTMLGWATGWRPLTDWNDAGISMVPNAALAAAACGLALLLLLRTEAHHRGRVPAILCVHTAAGLSVLIGSATLFQHVTGVNLGIDTLLFHQPWETLATAAPMRSGPPAAAAFVLLGMALMLTMRGPRERRLASRLALATLAIASLSLVGYWFGADRLFGVARVTGISWQTSTMVAALAAGLIAAVPEHGLIALLRRDDPGGVLARRLLLPVVAVPLLLLWVRILGQQAGLYDTAFAAAVVALAMIGMLVAMLWWTANGLSREHRALQAADEAVRAGNERLERAQQAAHLGLWDIDLRSREVTWSEGMYALMGMPPSFRPRMDSWRRLIREEDLPAIRAGMRDAMEHGGEFSVEFRVRRADGFEQWIASRGRVEFGPDASPARLLGVNIDVTERKHAEQALREADRRKDEFLATLAHELRNPLSAICTAADIMELSRDDRSRHDEMTAIIRRQSSQLVRLIDDLLDISRITRGTIQLRMERVDLGTAMMQAVDIAKPVCDARRLRLSVEPPAGPIMLEADPARLSQIIGNLLSNACKFTEADGHIRLRAQVEGTEAVIRVQDTGVGIDAGELSGIFEMFTQVGDAHRRWPEGLGIGLSLARKLAELHRGTIEARSGGVGRGSEFIVRLPIATATAQDPGRAQPAADMAESDDRAAATRVLVVDDHADALDAVATLLRLSGHVVYTAGTGEEAVERAEHLRPDAVLLDIGLPGISGYEAARRIRLTPWGSEVRLIAMTGWGQEKDKRRAIEAGFDAHVTKPADPRLLERMLARGERRADTAGASTG